MGHGTRFRQMAVVQGQQQSTVAADPKDFPGFGYLLGLPRPWQRSRWGDDRAAARGVLARLVEALPATAEWTSPLKPGIAPDDNPFIPSGYTYLMQFVAHDLVQTAVPFWDAAARGIGSANNRSQGMMLDALYGGGPLTCPAAYEHAAANTNDTESPTRLRLGGIAGATGSGPGNARDLRRGTRQSGHAPRMPEHAGCPLAPAVRAADSRNGDNPILAQLAGLFSLAHNIIADNVQPVRPEARHAYARAIMQAVYHSIIRCDLLPRLLHPAIWRALNERAPNSEDWLWQQSGVPLELSHGALRVGHAMVRPGYILNDWQEQWTVAQIMTGNRGAAGAPCMPLPAESPTESPADPIVQWSRLFNLGSTPDYSRRISATRSSLDFRGLLPADETSFPDAVTFRDLLSAAAARMWSVDAMLGAIMERSPGLIPAGGMFANPVRRRSLIAQWLTKIAARSVSLTDADILQLSNDPPLPLFILLEAGLDPILRGRCLGMLGSVIVGEVMFKRLAMERDRLEMLRTAAHTALPADLAAAVAAIDSMPTLVQFAAQFGGFGARTELPFI
jgi:Animal haem peroxidase